MTRMPIAISCLLAAVSAMPAAAAPTCGATVYANVLLTADLVCPPGSDGIVIGADNLRVDLNGYAITTPTHVWGSRGIRANGFKGIKVSGPGRIDNFTSGVVLNGGGFHEVRGVDITAPTGTSIVLADASDSIVEDNRAVAIHVRSGVASRADANRIAGNVARTVWVEGCATTNTEVSGNHLGGNTIFVSVGLLAGSTRTRVYGNTIEDGSVYIAGSSDNAVEANSITNAPTRGSGYSGVVISGSLSYCSGRGATSEPAGFNLVRGNGIMGGDYGVRLVATSYKNAITGNKLYDAATTGLSFTAGADDNDARGNTISGAPTPVIDMGRGNLWP